MFSMRQRLCAEFFGTFWLVLGGCGTAVLASYNVKFLGVAFAFGLTVVTMAYAVGHVSGGHFNPAITVGVAMGKRFDWKDVPAYVVTQVVAAIAASAVLFAIASGKDGFSAKETGFATNGYGERSPDGYSLLAVIIVEVVLTAFFVYVVLGVTDTPAPKGFAPLAIGLTLTGDPPDLDPGGQHLGQPRPVDRPGPVCRHGRDLPAVGLHPGSAPRWGHRRRQLHLPLRRRLARGATGRGHRGLISPLLTGPPPTEET